MLLALLLLCQLLSCCLCCLLLAGHSDMCTGHHLLLHHGQLYQCSLSVLGFQLLLLLCFSRQLLIQSGPAKTCNTCTPCTKDPLQHATLYSRRLHGAHCRPRRHNGGSHCHDGHVPGNCACLRICHHLLPQGKPDVRTLNCHKLSAVHPLPHTASWLDGMLQAHCLPTCSPVLSLLLDPV